MKRVAIVLAGGDGFTEKREVPRQFINVYDKPILVYTLEGFQRHPQIDEIEVVCVDGWQQITWAYAKQFNITKLKWVVTGGDSIQESIRNGVFNLEVELSHDDIVVIHDGIRPLIDESVLTDVLLVAKNKGNAISALPYNEQLFIISDEDPSITTGYISRDTIKRVLTPQAFMFGELLDAYQKAFEQNLGIGNDSYTDTLMVDLGYKLYFSVGSEKNIKLSSEDDFNMFKMYLHQDKDIWLK